ncbi:hypothetical protein [Arthrobacter sp. 24S4-2]|uniref:hypothetical protein n=1 Tax=Arthrobacter sp. 24S4-2 TaxID=2575374 RepID=UPI0034A0B779
MDVGRAWIRGEVRMGDAHRAAFQANDAAAATRHGPLSCPHLRAARRRQLLAAQPDPHRRVVT